MNRSTVMRSVAIGAAVMALAALAVLYIAPPGSTTARTDTFTIATAFVLTGYLLFPVLALLGSGLLLVAVMLSVAALIERRRESLPTPSNENSRGRRT